MSARDEPIWGLGAAWAGLVERALASTGGEEVVLETLALASAVDLVPGTLDGVSANVRRRLVARGAALLLASSREGDDTDEGLARSRALALARDGLDALRTAGARERSAGSERPAARERAKEKTKAPPGAEPGPRAAEEGARRTLVAPAMLRRLLEGKLDGFAAAELARQVRASAEARVELGVLSRHPRREPASAAARPAAAPRLRLVADDAPALRDPAEGTPVGTARSGAIELEAVRFADGVVAIYAAPARRISVPVLPSGVKVVRTAMGYVELDVRKSRAKEVDVAVGSHRVPLAIR